MTRIDEKLGSEPIISFEFGPPRTVEAELAFWSAIEELAALEPAFVSVTCGAGGTTRDLTLAVVRRLARERGLEAVPHVTATGFTRDELVELLAEAAAGGVTIGVLAKLAERGDIGPDERVVAMVTGDGLKTIDAVRDTFEVTTIPASLDAFDEKFAPVAV